MNSRKLIFKILSKYARQTRLAPVLTVWAGLGPTQHLGGLDKYPVISRHWSWCSTMPTTMRLDEDERVAGHWLDVKQAAEELGISSDAVRKRIARGSVRATKGEEGSVRVWLDDDQPTGWTEAGQRLDDLISAKDEALLDLRDQLEYMRRESERKDAIIMQMAQANTALSARIPELEAPRDERESPVSDEEGPPYGTAPEDAEESLHHVPYGEASPGRRGATEEPRAPWWRRWFGF